MFTDEQASHVSEAIRRYESGEWTAEHAASVLDIWIDDGDPLLEAWQRLRREADAAFVRSVKRSLEVA